MNIVYGPSKMNKSLISPWSLYVQMATILSCKCYTQLASVHVGNEKKLIEFGVKNNTVKFR